MPLPRPWRLRLARPSDLDRVEDIEHQAHPSAWPRSIFLSELSLPWASLRVLEHPKHGVVGFLDYWLIDEELHIMNIALLPRWRGHGLGSALISLSVVEAVAMGAEIISLEVRETNVAALRLYERHGFRLLGRQRKYYVDTGEAALFMVKEVPNGRL